MKCAICEIEITAEGKGGYKRQYCSQKCRSRARYLKRRAEIESRPGFIIASCNACGDHFERSTQRGGVKLYCSSECKKIGSAAARWGTTAQQHYNFINHPEVCSICRQHQTEVSPPILVVDHDHSCCPGYRSCGKCIRARICNSCNTALGYMQDDPTRLRRAAEYIEFYRAIFDEDKEANDV